MEVRTCLGLAWNRRSAASIPKGVFTVSDAVESVILCSSWTFRRVSSLGSMTVEVEKSTVQFRSIRLECRSGSSIRFFLVTFKYIQFLAFEYIS